MKNDPEVSYYFNKTSLYYNGFYYFIDTIKPSNVRDGKEFQIQCIYKEGKLYQDTRYISAEFKEYLINFFTPLNNLK
jgi:hypothetical protein